MIVNCDNNLPMPLELSFLNFKIFAYSFNESYSKFSSKFLNTWLVIVGILGILTYYLGWFWDRLVMDSWVVILIVEFMLMH
jgi:hypothetical protein